MQSSPILQTGLMDPPWALPKGTQLPGTSLIMADDWMRWDDAYAAQMTLRDELISDKLNDVHALQGEAHAAGQELLRMALSILKTRSDYGVGDHMVTRPGGGRIRLDWDNPLITLGRLVQQDFCILQQNGDEHVMTGAILCFPASWSLAEKIGRSLIGIHDPVDEYDPGIAKRVQRLFDAIQPGRPMVRANCLLYADPDLHQPRKMDQRREKPGAIARYVRTERQCFIRLPETGAVAFSIHTTVILREDLPLSDQAALTDYLENHISI